MHSIFLSQAVHQTSQVQDCGDTKDLTGTGHQVPRNVQNWARKKRSQGMMERFNVVLGGLSLTKSTPPSGMELPEINLEGLSLIKSRD